MEMEATTEFIDECLKIHNKFRVLHNSPELEIDQDLNDYAKEKAKYLAEKDMILRRKRKPYGENAYMSPGTIIPAEAIEFWYSQKIFYEFDDQDPRYVEKVENFTQLVWKSSTALGVGLSQNNLGNCFLVCVYDPPGNIEGEFGANVLPVPPKEAPTTLLTEEELSLNYVEPDEKVVKLNRLLRAVPSEMLRVWTVWLAKVIELANEWQKWLRAHIDLFLRISQHLREAELVVAKECTLVPFERQVLVKILGEEALEIEELDEAADEQAPDADKKPEGEDSGSPEATAAENEAWDFKWPIGVPWEPLDTAEEKPEELIQVLEMPSSEEKMLDFIRNFTCYATMYRSFYRHWLETANRAEVEMLDREVVSTYELAILHNRKFPVKSASVRRRSSSVASGTRVRRRTITCGIYHSSACKRSLPPTQKCEPSGSPCPGAWPCEYVPPPPPRPRCVPLNSKPCRPRLCKPRPCGPKLCVSPKPLPCPPAMKRLKPRFVKCRKLATRSKCCPAVTRGDNSTKCEGDPAKCGEDLVSGKFERGPPPACPEDSSKFDRRPAVCVKDLSGLIRCCPAVKCPGDFPESTTCCPERPAGDPPRSPCAFKPSWRSSWLKSYFPSECANLSMEKLAKPRSNCCVRPPPQKQSWSPTLKCRRTSFPSTCLQLHCCPGTCTSESDYPLIPFPKPEVRPCWPSAESVLSSTIAAPPRCALPLLEGKCVSPEQTQRLPKPCERRVCYPRPPRPPRACTMPCAWSGFPICSTSTPSPTPSWCEAAGLVDPLKSRPPKQSRKRKPAAKTDPKVSGDDVPEGTQEAATLEDKTENEEGKEEEEEEEEEEKQQEEENEVEKEKVDPVLRDLARAEEPVPYFFHVTCEVNMEIAEEHDDEVYIPRDFYRERISADFNQHLYFNLSKKLET